MIRCKLFFVNGEFIRNLVRSALFLAVALAGCTGLVSPGVSQTTQGPPAAQQPAAAQQQDGKVQDSVETGDAPATDLTSPTNFPMIPTSPPAAAEKEPYAGAYPVFAAADTHTKPHPGGVSALPPAVQDGHSEQPKFDYTYSGNAIPYCKSPMSGGGATVQYRVSGVVGAVLWDGTKSFLNSGCESLFVRFQSVVAKNTVDCQDLSVNEACQFQGTIKIAPVQGDDYEAPSAFVLQYAPSTECGKVHNITSRSRVNDFTFLEVGSGESTELKNLPMCTTLMMDVEKKMFQKTISH